MSVRSRLLGSATILSTAMLGSCTNGVFSSPSYLSVIISPRPASMAVNAAIQFTGTASNDLGIPQWTILSGSATGTPGTLTAVAGMPNAILYTAPATPPIYNSSASAITQGTITLQATVAPPAESTLATAHDSITMFITAAAVTAGISPTSATVARGSVQLFSGYAVGAVDNAVTYQVNGVTGGSVGAGSITTTGYYTAPANLPMTGNTVTVTATAHADPTKTASAIVTLQ